MRFRFRSRLAASRRFCGALLLAAVGLGGCGDPQLLKVGFIGNTSRRGADLGIGGRDGAQLAIETRNAAGGIDGRRIVGVIIDAFGDATRDTFITTIEDGRFRRYRPPQ